MRMKCLSLIFLLVSSLAYADVSGGGLTDYYGNGLTSGTYSGTRNPFDVEQVISGSIVDPRTRTWNLSASDVPACTQSGSWSVSTLAAADSVVSGTITTQDLVSTPSTQYNGQVWYTGTPTAGSFVSTALTGIETGMVTISNTFTGTVQIEISNDGGVSYLAHSIHQVGGSFFISSATAPLTGSLNLAGKTNIRVRAISGITGTVSVRFNLSQNQSSVYVANSIKLVDGSSATSLTPMNIVPASTAVASTNTAIAVGLSPNSPLPAGTLSIGQVTANAGTNLNTSALTLQSGANTMLDKSGSGTIVALNGSVVATTNGASTVAFIISGTWSATLFFEGMNQDGTWTVLYADSVGFGFDSSVQFSSTNGTYIVNAAGFSQIRVLGQSYASGTVAVGWNSGAGLRTIKTFQPTPADFQATVTQAATPWIDNLTQFGGTNLSTGTGASGSGIPRVTVANDSKVITWDGTNTQTVKAGSTQAALTDTALVITGRPDNVGTPTQTSVSCAATTTTLLAASTATQFLSVRNPTTSTVTIWINVAGASAVSAAPSLDLPPGSEAYFAAEGASFLPTSQINCISGGSASSVTITYK
jgi:hypothetical protein